MEDQGESVRHLVELGYVDPDEVAARDATRSQELETRLSQAVELYRQGRGEEAVPLLQAVGSDDPDWISPRQLLAEIHYRSGRWDQAQFAIDWLADHGVDSPRRALIAGGIAIVRREYRSALEDLNYARYVDPKLPSVHTLLGTVLLRLGRLDEAEDAFREAAEQNPRDARARDGVAAVFLRHGEYDEAADWALRALEQDIQLFRAHYHLGIALVHLHRFEEALQALEASVGVEPARAAPYHWLSRIAQRNLNDRDRAERYRALGRDVVRRRRDRRQRQ
jgi:tetratricopeptide (TPR) repeat protein